MKDIVYFRGTAFNLVNVCVQSKNPDPKCPFSNYSYYVNLVRSTCPELLINCLFDKKEFDCCKYFVPIHTDMGTCFALNSVQVKNPILYPMVFNVTQKEGVLKFETLLNTMLYTLGEDEIPTVTTLTSSTLKLVLGKNYQRQVVVKNIENDPLTVETTPAQRACRFSYENDNGLYPLYSYSTCTVLCRKREQMKLCGCTDHFMIGSDESKMCNASGLLCLHRHFSQLTTLKPRWAGRRPGLVCDCLPSCDETEITIIKDAVTSAGRARKKRIAVELKMAYLPTERFKRNVVRSRLDLVVSIGGAAGLFVGASLLSFVELIFFFTIRLLDNIYLEKRKKKEKTTVRNMKTFQPAMPRSTMRFYSQRSNLITFRP
ncbi:pickpocket protein 19-like isoform X1 [Pieris napi]|uniref:pickpocket protein 19-like isoform X1 n=2 Tax=Pieris napi TaxID=78633 RepID=UPI001FB9EC6E|nr:pickpocket protein 19-like isoform X1 [Pieris napi]